MCTSQCLLAVLALFISTVNSWDIAITTGSQIEFYINGSRTNDQGVRSTGLTALAYDAVHNMLLYVDKQSDNASIFRFNLATNQAQALVGRKLYEGIQGIAYDPVSNKVFWINEGEKAIYWKSLKSKDVYGQKLDVNLNDQVPKSIAVDSCRGFLYWSNINISHPTIERVRIDGLDRKVIINTDIYLPMSITIDQQTRQIFWVDDREGIHYSIETSDLLGNKRKTINRGIHHSPRAITVSKDNLYWIDAGYRAVWKIPKTATADDGKKEPSLVFEFVEPMEPVGIVANYTIEDQTEGIEECAVLRHISKNATVLGDPEGIPGDAGVFCLHGKKVDGKSQCECKLGYTGERCEIPVCINYCFEGECLFTDDGQPICRCKNGYTGKRCEINPCHDQCMNNGQCVVKKNKATCLCSGEYTGDRCERKKTDVVRSAEEKSCNCTTANAAFTPTENLLASDGEFVASCNNGWDPLRDPIMMVLGTLCGLLCVACTLLITKVMQLKKRPRIKKRIIVQKNSTPLTARPDQCEITIENCCNMNICETPCFEPRSTIRPNLLDSKPGKEEKKNLISNMELPDDY